MRHGNVITRPLEQRPWQELCCGPRLCVPTASIQGHQGSAKGHMCCICCPQRDSIPSSCKKPLHSQLCFESWTRGISATCRCCTVVPKTWSGSHSQSTVPGLQLLALAGMAECGCCGIPVAVKEWGWHPGQTQVANTVGRPGTAELALFFSPAMCHLFGQMSKSELLHFMQLW